MRYQHKLILMCDIMIEDNFKTYRKLLFKDPNLATKEEQIFIVKKTTFYILDILIFIAILYWYKYKRYEMIALYIMWRISESLGILAKSYKEYVDNGLTKKDIKKSKQKSER